MKKFFSFAAVAALLLSGCVKENIATVENGEKVTVTFTTELPIEVSRAYVGDGTKADVVKYGIYNQKTGELYPDYNYQDLEISGKVARLTLDLVKGLEYRIAFWAQNSNAPYTFDRVAKTVTADYSNVDANDEILDAFFSIDTILVKGPITKSVTLRRPFAQINLGATKADVVAAAALGVTIDETTVELTDVYTTMNLLDGSIDKSAAQTVSFKLNALPGNDLRVNEVDYEYLAANYIFAEAEPSVTDLTFGVYQNGTKINEASVPAVNYKRNYRTNILGRLLTSSVDYTIVIDGTPEGDLGESWVDEDGNPILAEPVLVEANTATGEAAHYSVSNASQLAWLAAAVNGTLPTQFSTRAADNYAGKTFKLYSDVDLQGVEWTPIGTSAAPFKGHFDGQGYTVKNLVVTGYNSNVGLFGETRDGSIKNLTVENAKVSGRLNVGVVAGHPYTSKYSNITVKGHVEVNGMAYVGGVGGKDAYANWSNITVNVDETSYVKANSVENGNAYRTYVGGVIGFMGEGGHTVENVYSNIDVIGSTIDAGGIVGIAHYNNNFKNVTCEATVELTDAPEAADAQEIGGIAGVWHNENGTKVTFTNCHFNGELKANFPINNKYGNLVCSAYKANGTGVLVIDGVEYTQTEAGVVVNGGVVVSTADELIEALEGGRSVVFSNNIKIAPATMSNAYGKTGINVKHGQTIDGAGFTLDIKGAGETWDSGICTSGGLIKNLKVTGSFRGVFVKSYAQNSKVVLDNVVIDGTTYTISVDQASKQGIEAKNSTFNGWTSYAATIGEVSFTKCSFGLGNGYKFCRPYANTVFTDCDFCEGYTIDPALAAVVSFDGCTLNGVALTAENIATLVTNTAKVVSVK